MADIETLRQQHKDARAASSAAKTVEADALRALRNGLVDATGLRGHVVEGPVSPYAGADKAKILVRSIGRWDEKRVMGDVIKKDGTPGERTKEILIEGAVSLGLYEETK